MDARDLQQIDVFLAEVGQSSLLEYYGLGSSAPADDIKARIKDKRAWAQAQQANPKFRTQALWLIKNNKLVQRVLIEQMQAYVDAVSARERDRKLQMLDLFVQGSLVSGKLSDQAEAAIRRQASELGLSDTETQRYLEEKVGLDSTGPEGLFDDIAGLDGEERIDDFVDYYGLLQVNQQATSAEIEEAYRGRYRWARTLKDLQRANEIYKQLEQAWRVLSETSRRREYDDLLRRRQSTKHPVVPAFLADLDSTPDEDEIAERTPADADLPGDDLEEEPSEQPSEIRMGRPRWARGDEEESSDSLAKALGSKDLRLESDRASPPTPATSRTFRPGSPGRPPPPPPPPPHNAEGPPPPAELSAGALLGGRPAHATPPGSRWRAPTRSSSGWASGPPPARWW